MALLFNISPGKEISVVKRVYGLSGVAGRGSSVSVHGAVVYGDEAPE